MGAGGSRCVGSVLVWGGRVVEIKLVSWIVRGLGRMEKRRVVRLLVAEKRLWIVCLQETNMTVCDIAVCSSLWGSWSHEFSFRPSLGASVGGVVDGVGQCEGRSVVNY